MKNKLKLLSVLILTLVFGFNTLNTYAYDPYDDSICGEGEVLHTNYYIFIDVGKKSTYMNSNHTDNGTKSWTHYTGAPKYNNIHSEVTPGGRILARGTVAITNGDQINFDEETSIMWTATEYWQHFYDALNDLKFGAQSKNKVYNEDIKTTYLFHNGAWWSYESEAQVNNAGTQHNSGEASNDKLYNYLKSNISRLETSTLVTRGTVLPNTHITENLAAETEDNSFFFRVSRRFTPESLAAVPGFTLGNDVDVLYSPGVYYAQYCIKSGERTIEYDQNYEGEAPKNMPENQTFDGACDNLSDKIPEREGYEFLGWNTDKDADKPAMYAGTSDLKYAPGEQYCGNSIKLYAIWKEKDAEEPATDEFTVTYDANKGTNAPAPQSGSVSDKKCVKISDQGKMTLAKNKFLGWSTKEDAAEADVKYAPGTEYCGENGDLTLYAIWNASTGVSAHVIAFAFVAVSAVAALVVAKKKNLFKQI